MSETKTSALVINAGSSSLKFAILDPSRGTLLASGLAERLGTKDAAYEWKNDERRETKSIPEGDHAKALELLANDLESKGLASSLAVVGHRVVHGGSLFAKSALVDEKVIEGIRSLVPLSPLHNPAALTGIEAARAKFPRLPQVAVFDTAFHQTIPESIHRYPVPASWLKDYGVRRYGFHGTNHRFVAEEAMRHFGLGKDAGILTLHLGNGCSGAAVQGGRSMDTTMGLTPLEGMMMGTRSGSIDPAVVAYVAERSGRTATQVLDDLNKKSGLLGVSGFSNDMRSVLAKADEGDAAAALAATMFAERIAKQAAALLTSLRSFEALVFTGGIGENSWQIREKVIASLWFLGLELEPSLHRERAKAPGLVVSAAKSRAKIILIPANEELAIAREAIPFI